MKRMKLAPHIHCIGIGGIGISALARYYLARGYRVTGTNMGHSPLLDALATEGIEIIEDGALSISPNTQKVIYTEAIIDDETLGLSGVRENHRTEIQSAEQYHCEILSYPEALAQVFNAFPMKIAVAGAHGKSTTSAMIGTILHDVQKNKEQERCLKGMSSTKSKVKEYNIGATTITGTLVKAFGGKNICIHGDSIMNIEACEYRNAFLHYHPDIAVITNIDPDHLDFFKTEEAYFAAFERFMQQSRCVVMLAGEYEKRQNGKWKMENGNCSVNKDFIIDLDSSSNIPLLTAMDTSIRNDGKTLILVHSDHFELIGEPFNNIQPGKYSFTLPPLLVPGDHIRLDATLAYVVSQLLHLDPENSQQSLVNYPGSWRRMEVIGTTANSNLVMSDYGHHPTEIIATLGALRTAYPQKKLIVFFEPHQYSRTYELREEFSTSFTSADMTYIVDIYAARDIDERREMITAEILSTMIAKNSPCEYTGSLKETAKILQKIDREETNALILLLGAGTIDELRHAIDTK